MAAQAVTSPCFRTADPCSKGLRTIRSFEKGVESQESELLVGEKGFRMASLLSYRPFLFPHPILSSSTLYPNIGPFQQPAERARVYNYGWYLSTETMTSVRLPAGCSVLCPPSKDA
ncbi:predicted protein [Chaetomium globosum CBS 148.51]|uniref:Uncharacterized protein n=1 Tax=Chaetomium globosum (strain ATCC 6205 / CBS 148.51 / DSM 1962 / NBRC 6347 / NRRL 1970) TaxID=306901 RepID=Q2GXT9_CHAGB|nr:uncharacterized protein CHGG_07215 [Chaetomium globosum CBS 148.51]EAQ85962.1 predicted protein [Chaetomium globosum CBS 148.51]